MNKIWLILFACGAVAASAAEPYVATWRGNKVAAVSYTFDDGLLDQYTELFPVFKRLGLKGTFFLNGRRQDQADVVDRHGAKSMTWTMVKEMSDAGQEMSNHGYAHKNHGRTPEAEVEEDIRRNAEAIEKATGKTPITYAYPNNAKNREWSAKVLRRCGIIASRTYQKGLGGKNTVESADALVAKAKREGGWAVFMTHGISVGYDRWVHPEAFFTHLEHVAADKEVWVDTFARVAIYERLRKETKVSVEETAEGWRIKVTKSDLDPLVFTGGLDLVLPDGTIRTFDPFGGDFEVTSGVRLRGVFINDEDWGLRPWAVKHFGKDEQIGTNTYAEVFALMRANGLNLLWPAMHEGGYEFSSRPENFELADRYGITIGTSHCEPMLRNNCYLPRSDQKKWSWLTNRDFITGYWREGVRRGDGHNVMYTLGMRGIHDGRMSDGTNTAQKVAILEEVFTVQKGLLPSSNSNSTTPTLFCPYKEVLPIFNAGLKVPDETTIMWVNDNFGYIRRLGGPQVEGRPQGIYYHASYHGHPHGYIHLCTTPPALLWYELCAKAWNNGVRDVWMLNAGDVFQAELLLSCYGKLAGNPEGYGPAAQDELLAQAVSEKLNVKSEELQGRIVAHLNEYYSLGFNRKPEHMCIQWTTNLPQTVKAELLGRYKAFLAEDLEIERQLSSSSLDLYYRLIGFQAQFLAQAGIIHLEGRDKSYARSVIDPLYERWNNLEDGKWAGFWCDTIDENGGMRQPTTSNRWSSQMQWPWNEPADPYKKDRKGTSRSQYTATAYRANVPEPTWLEPISSTLANGGAWTRVTGLGTSGRAHALLPVKPGVGKGASLTYTLPPPPSTSTSSLVLQFLPDFALWPSLNLGVNIRFDGGAIQYVAVPKSDSNLGEKDPVRAVAVQDNFIRVAVPIPAGAKRVEILATDPGVVLDRVGVR